MASQTPFAHLWYPLSTDPPDGATQIALLATGVDTALSSNYVKMGGNAPVASYTTTASLATAATVSFTPLNPDWSTATVLFWVTAYVPVGASVNFQTVWQSGSSTTLGVAAAQHGTYAYSGYKAWNRGTDGTSIVINFQAQHVSVSAAVTNISVTYLALRTG